MTREPRRLGIFVYKKRHFDILLPHKKERIMAALTSVPQQAEQRSGAYEKFYIIAEDKVTGERLYSRAVGDLEKSPVSLVFQNSMQPFAELETNPRLKSWVQGLKSDRLPADGNWKPEERLRTAAKATYEDTREYAGVLKEVEQVQINTALPGPVLQVPSLETEVLAMIPRICLAAFQKLCIDHSTFHISCAGSDFSAHQMFSHPERISLESEEVPARGIIRATKVDLSAFKSEGRITYTPKV